MGNVANFAQDVNGGKAAHAGQYDADCERPVVTKQKILATARLSREQGRDAVAAHLRAAITDIDGQSCETVARAIGFSSRDLVSRQCRGHKPVQLGDVYAMPKSVALRLIRSVLHDLESTKDTRPLEAVAMRACGHAAGLAARIAEMLEDGHIDNQEGVELRAKSRGLVSDLLNLASRIG